MKFVLLAVVTVMTATSMDAATCKVGCPEIFKPVCGSDGKSYDNQCSFDYAKCSTNNETLKVVSDGNCPNNDCDKKSCTAIYTPVCGSDGKTYSNPCDLEIARCKNSNLKVASDGECSGASKSDAKDGNCAKTMCTLDYSPVCGSDGQTYFNKCKLDQAACTDTSLKQVSTGECGTASSQANDTASSQAKDSSDVGNAVGCEEFACTQAIVPVCGSDGNTYNNICLLKKASCTAPGLIKKSDGECGKSVPPATKNGATSMIGSIIMVVLMAMATITLV